MRQLNAYGKRQFNLTPQTLSDVRMMAKKKLLWKLGLPRRAACRRIVEKHLADLPNKYKYPAQVPAYLAAKAELDGLLSQLQDAD